MFPNPVVTTFVYFVQMLYCSLLLKEGEVAMPRLSIDLTPEQHKRLKAIAALRGQSIKDYVLQQSLEGAPMTEQEALQELDAFLKPRVEEAQSGRTISRSASEIFETVRKAT